MAAQIGDVGWTNREGGGQHHSFWGVGEREMMDQGLKRLWLSVRRGVVDRQCGPGLDKLSFVYKQSFVATQSLVQVWLLWFTAQSCTTQFLVLQHSPKSRQGYSGLQHSP